MAFPASFIDELVARNPIEDVVGQYVNLKRAGANMFGRMGNYFELGTICILPKMLKKTFDEKSYWLVTALACVCFLGFFVYANAISMDFGQAYRSISLLQFFDLLF